MSSRGLRQSLRLAPQVLRQTIFRQASRARSLNPPRGAQLVAAPQTLRCRSCQFSTGARLQKSKKSKPSSAPSGPPAGKGSASGVSDGPDPFDFSELQASIATAVERLESAIKLLRPGGRLAPETLEAIRVKLPGPSSGSAAGGAAADAKGAKGAQKQSRAASGAGGGDTVRLGDLAQVVPRSGRTLALLLTDAAHAKAVTSALLSSPLGLNATAPQGGEGTELHVAVPPPTQESRNAAKAQAAEAGDKATRAVRDARQAQHKKHRAMEQAKQSRPDDIKRATTKMEDVVKKANEDVKKIVDAARKAMDG